MTTQTTANGAANAAPVKRGFGNLTCLKCGQEACVKVDLDDLRTFTCRECEDEFTAEDVRAVLGQWQRVLSWLDSAPA